MAKIEKKVSATICFKADSTFPNLKRYLDKKSGKCYAMNPAIELETGLMVATNGFIMAVHKLKDYHYEQSENAVVGPMAILPADVLNMKGEVKVEVVMEGYETIVVATDSAGAHCEYMERYRYPKWRQIIPGYTGWPAEVNAKAWDDALKKLITKRGKSTFVTQVYADSKSKTVDFIHTDDDTQKESRTQTDFCEMPYMISFFVNGRLLRDVMTLQPTAMRFLDSTHTVSFYNDETLSIIMPILLGDACEADKNYCNSFILDRWIDGQQTPKNKPINESANKPASGTTLSDRLRAALSDKLRKAA